MHTLGVSLVLAIVSIPAEISRHACLTPGTGMYGQLVGQISHHVVRAMQGPKLWRADRPDAAARLRTKTFH